MNIQRVIARLAHPETADPRSKAMPLRERAFQFFMSSTHVSDKERLMREIKLLAYNPRNYWGFQEADIGHPDLEKAYEDYMRELKDRKKFSHSSSVASDRKLPLKL